MRQKITASMLATTALQQILHDDGETTSDSASYKNMSLQYWIFYPDLANIPLEKLDEAYYSSKVEYGENWEIYGDAIVNIDNRDIHLLTFKTLDANEKTRQVMLELVDAFINKFSHMVQLQIRLEKKYAYENAFEQFEVEDVNFVVNHFSENEKVDEKHAMVYFYFESKNKARLKELWNLYIGEYANVLTFEDSLKEIQEEYQHEANPIGLCVAVDMVVDDSQGQSSGWWRSCGTTIAIVDDYDGGMSDHSITQIEDVDNRFEDAARKAITIKLFNSHKVK